MGSNWLSNCVNGKEMFTRNGTTWNARCCTECFKVVTDKTGEFIREMRAECYNAYQETEHK